MINHNVECCDECKTHEDLLKIVNDNMPDEDELYDLAELFKVFGDSTRIRILFVLFESEVCVCSKFLPNHIHILQIQIIQKVYVFL